MKRILFAVLLATASIPARAADPCEFDRIERVVAVGDVHGAYDRYLEILRAAGIVDADGHWSGGRTHFVQIGDLVDRGGDSRKVLDLLRRLEREAPRSGGRVHILLGNHEVARMLGDLRLTTAAEYAAFTTPDSERLRERFVQMANLPESGREALVKQTPLGWIEMRQAFGREGEYGKWLREHPVTITIDGFAFVHGGLSPAVAPLGCAAINAQVKRELSEDLDKTRAAPLASLAARVDGPLWYRGLAQEPETFAPQVEAMMTAIHARAIVIGHTVAPAGKIATRFGGRVIEIDTGMQQGYVSDGRASALEILNGGTTAIYADHREPVTVAGDPRR